MLSDSISDRTLALLFINALNRKSFGFFVPLDIYNVLPQKPIDGISADCAAVCAVNAITANIINNNFFIIFWF